MFVLSPPNSKFRHISTLRATHMFSSQVQAAYFSCECVHIFSTVPYFGSVLFNKVLHLLTNAPFPLFATYLKKFMRKAAFYTWDVFDKCTRVVWKSFSSRSFFVRCPRPCLFVRKTNVCHQNKIAALLHRKEKFSQEIEWKYKEIEWKYKMRLL